MIKKFITVLIGISYLITSTVFAGAWSCTGFFVSNDGKVVTAGHCVPNDKVKIKVIYKGKVYTGKILAHSRNPDVAVVSVDAIPSFVYTLKLSIKDGETVFVLGYPQPNRFGYNMKIRQGYIKPVTSGSDGDYNIFDAVTFGGNSGGPVINTNNEVVGILVAGYEIPILDGAFHSLATPAIHILEVLGPLNPGINIGPNTNITYGMQEVKTIAERNNSVVFIIGEGNDDE